jgi:hypothetical protein
MSIQPVHSRRQPDSLADVLERVLDKGIVIAGDVVVNVLDIELLTLKLRLFIASADTAREMGMDWWTRDPFFSSNAQVQEIDDGGEREPGRHGQPRQISGGAPQRRPGRSQRQLQEENDMLRRRLAELEARVGASEGEQA